MTRISLPVNALAPHHATPCPGATLEADAPTPAGKPGSRDRHPCILTRSKVLRNSTQINHKDQGRRVLAPLARIRLTIKIEYNTFC